MNMFFNKMHIDFDFHKHFLWIVVWQQLKPGDWNRYPESLRENFRWELIRLEVLILHTFLYKFTSKLSFECLSTKGIVELVLLSGLFAGYWQIIESYTECRKASEKSNRQYFLTKYVHSKRIRIFQNLDHYFHVKCYFLDLLLWNV